MALQSPVTAIRFRGQTRDGVVRPLAPEGAVYVAEIDGKRLQKFVRQ